MLIIILSRSVNAEIIDVSQLKFNPFIYNSNLQEFGPTLSDDGNTLFFYTKRNNSLYTDIYKSVKINGKWQKPEEISAINSNYDDQSPYYDAKQNFIIFSSNRDNSTEFTLPNGKIGISRDLFISFFENGNWTIPRQLDKNINTAYNEENPFIFGNILLFTRYPFGHVEMAKIYKSEYSDGKWSKPLILGAPVNDEYASISASISRDGKYIYFASNRPGGFGGFDIYRSPITEKGMGIPENLGTNINTERDEAFFIQNKDDVLFCRKEKKTNYDILMNDMSAANAVNELRTTKKLTTARIYFDHDSSVILPESINLLDAVSEFLKKNNHKIKITGHTSQTGSADYNMDLSKERAQSVEEYFITKGVNKNRIQTEGKGDTMLISDEDSKNRRTDFELIN